MQFQERFEGAGGRFAFSEDQAVGQGSQFFIEGEGLEFPVGVIFRDHLQRQDADADIRFHKIYDPFY